MNRELRITGSWETVVYVLHKGHALKWYTLPYGRNTLCAMARNIENELGRKIFEGVENPELE